MHPVAWFSAAFVAGVGVAPEASGVPAIWSAFGLGASVLALARPQLLARFGLAIAGTCLGISLCRALPPGPALRGPVIAEGVVVGASGRDAEIALSRWTRPGRPWEDATGRIRATFPEPSAPPGTAVRLRGEAHDNRADALPGAPDPIRAARRTGVRTWVRIDASEWGTRPPRPDTANDPTGVLRALALGDLAGLSEADRLVFRRTGTSHLLSVSGFHVGAVAALCALGLLTLTRWIGLFTGRGLSTAPGILLSAAVGAAYAWLAGAPLPAQRAALALGLGAIGRAGGRLGDPLALLGLAAIGTLLVNPGAVAQASWQLSFSALLGLLRVTPWLLRWLPPDLPRPARLLAESAAGTTGCAVGTLPAAAWWFQEWAPLTLPANLLALPLSSVWLVPCSALATFGPPHLAAWAGRAGTVGSELLLFLLRPLAVEPWHPAVGPLGALALVVPLLFRPRIRWWLPAAVLALWPARWPSVDTATFLSVGQGDAALLQGADGTAILVDGGPPGEGVVRWLRRSGIRHLDAVVATHGHLDHIGGLIPVIQQLQVDRLEVRDAEGMAPLLAAAATRGVPVVWPTDVGVLHPPPGFPAKDRNDRSIVLRWGPVLMAGDAGLAAEAALSTAAPAPVLKVGHHGSRTATSAAWLNQIRPRLAIVSVGAHNVFGHPHADVLQRLAAAGIAVRRTDVVGTIQVAETPGGLSVRAWRAGAGWTEPEWFER